MIDFKNMKLAINDYAKDYILLARVEQKMGKDDDLQKILDFAQDKIEENLIDAWNKFVKEIEEYKIKPLIEIIDWIQKHPELIEWKDDKIYYKPDGSVMMEVDQ